MSGKGIVVLLKEVERQTKTKVIDAVKVGDDGPMFVRFTKKSDRHINLLNNFIVGNEVRLVNENENLPELQTCAVTWFCKQHEWLA